MSELLLKAILKLFAVVAKEDDVNRQEREQIRIFLEEHISIANVESYLQFFDEYEKTIVSKHGDLTVIHEICQEINPQLTQKQKIVIVLELVTIIQSDGAISDHEDHLVKAIGSNFKITEDEVEAIEVFVFGKNPETMDNSSILLVDSSDGKIVKKAKHLTREGLNGFIAVLFIDAVDIFFIKYIGGSDVYLNGVPVKSGKISVLAVGSNLRWEKDDPVYYGSILAKFKSFGDHGRTSFEAKNI